MTKPRETHRATPAAPELRDVPLNEFALQETQARVRLDPTTIEDYAEAMAG